MPDNLKYVNQHAQQLQQFSQHINRYAQQLQQFPRWWEFRARQSLCSTIAAIPTLSLLSISIAMLGNCSKSPTSGKSWTPLDFNTSPQKISFNKRTSVCKSNKYLPITKARCLAISQSHHRAITRWTILPKK